MKSGKIDKNGQSLYYEVHGEGPPLILIMGIGYDATLWGLHQVPAFSKNNQVIVFDNRDVGRSSQASGPYTIADMADDIVTVLDGLKIDRANVLGISMGGMIAQEFALRHPDRLGKLVMTGTSADNAQAKFDPISVWDFVKSHDKEGLKFASQQFLWLFSDTFLRNPEAVDQTLQMLASNPNPQSADAYGRQVDAYVKHDTLSRLSEIKAQTLVVCGERDRLTPPWVCRRVADAIPGARYHQIDGPGSSHVVPLERPDDFNAVVMSFLEN
ncbi:MAG: alpha/beta fold hydrolase [Candidatus Hodarchaeales archaeon]|jgi:pimeloyl-ACP methyl ester carboxylesterase